jgi:hypothetical protein
MAFYSLLLALTARWLWRWLPAVASPLSALVVPLTAFGLVRMALSFVVGGFDSPPGAIYFWLVVGMTARLATGWPAAQTARDWRQQDGGGQDSDDRDAAGGLRPAPGALR